MCNVPIGGWKALLNLADSYTQWSITVDSKWGGLAFFSPSKDDSAGTCGGSWWVFIDYVYQGPQSDEEFQNTLQIFNSWGAALVHNAFTYNTWAERMINQPLEPIIPVPWLPPIKLFYSGGVPSVCVSREMTANGSLAIFLRDSLNQCRDGKVCNRQELYNDITGNLDSPQDPNVSISDGLRTSLFHYVVGAHSLSDLNSSVYALGPASYFSESAFEMDSFAIRYWGANYAQLVKVKEAIDPYKRFGCHNCI
jgi:ribonuclease T2